MSLSLTANVVTQPNLVLLLAQSTAALAVRCASNGSSSLATLTAGTIQGPTVTWVITQNPSWVTITVDASTLICTVNFANAQSQANPYQFFITCTDGFTTKYFPILLDVKDPLTLVAVGGGTVFNIPSYDAAAPDIVIRGLGLNGIVESGVQFIPPVALPPGLNFITTDSTSMILRVDESTSENLPGGLSLFTDSPATMQVSLQAYLPGSMYDNPSQCLTQEFGIQSLTAQPGVLDIATSCYYNIADNAFRLDAAVDFLSGLAPSITYNWIVNGTATGTTTSGGTSSSNFLVWSPTGSGTVNFIFQVINTATSAVIGQVVIDPTLATGTGIPCAAAGSWISSGAIKLEISEAATTGFAGTSVNITVSTPSAELGGGETVYLTFVVAAASTQETAIAAPVSATLTAGTASTVVNIPLPTATPGINQKWTLQVFAENALSAPSRTGYATAVVESNGLPILEPSTSSGTAIASVTGTPLNRVTLLSLSSLSLPVTSTFQLMNAPAGLFVDGTNLLGNALIPGVYVFYVIALAAGYATGISPAITLTVTAQSVPLALSPAIASVSSLPDGQPFNVAWGFSGTPLALNLIQNFTVRNVLGATEAATSEVGSSVIAIYGESFYGSVYTVPTIVISSSITALGDLLNSPTIGTIDQNFDLTLNWQPAQVDGNYEVYKGWNIWLSAPLATPVLQQIHGQPPTGLEVAGSTASSRLFEETLTAGDWVINMQALSDNFTLAENATVWDDPHEFPATLASTQVTFDNQTISLGQSLTITLAPTYTGSDTWCVFFPDGTDSGFLPLSIRSVAKSFAVPGPTSIIVQTQNNFSTNNPPVKLNRQITLSVFVMDQKFNPGSTGGLGGILGFGGNEGFQITNASNGAVPLAPYEVVVRALVRDAMTNELKLMVATSRTSDASSLLGTMAMDVFPLLGRPRIKERIDPALYFTAEMATNDNPVLISTSALPNAIVGLPINDFPMQVATNSGVAPFSWYVDNLPDGLKMSINGTLTGTATTLGTEVCNFVVVDSNVPPFISTVTLAFTVESDLLITTTNIAVPVVNTPYSVQIAQSGGLPPYTWAIVSGATPLGLTIGINSGLLTGTPVTYNSTTDYLKVFSFTVQVTDAIGAIFSTVLTTRLNPAALSFGSIDQPNIFADESFNIRIPVFGGIPPYTLANFSDDGVIGPGLALVSPDAIKAVAGVTPEVLNITNGAQVFFPQGYATAIEFLLTAAGGTPPYQYAIIPGAFTTLLGAAIYGDMLVAYPTGNGFFYVQVQVTDANGTMATSTLGVEIQAQNNSYGDQYTIKPVTANLNSSTDPADWTITPIAALPNAENGSAYNAGAGIYYGLALYFANVLQLSQATGLSVAPMNFSILSGALPGGMIAFSGNSFAPPQDASGIVLFNVSGGSNPIVNGEYSFVGLFSNINVTSFYNPTFNTFQETVANRESITVTTPGGGSPVVVVVVTSTAGIIVNLTTSRVWFYPLIAEGGTAPYTFNIQTGSTLPGATIEQLNGLPALVSGTTSPGSYTVDVIATDSLGNVSAPAALSVVLEQSPTEPINIVNDNLPTALFTGRVIPTNVYYIQSDLLAKFSATGLPPGVTLTTATGFFSYLQGTPTTPGTYSMTFTATSVAYGTTATTPAEAITISPQTAVFSDPPTAATIGVDYRVINNAALIFILYTGWQPTDAGLPLPTSTTGTLGAPGTLNGGLPTTGIVSLSPTGFVMAFDYADAVLGVDTLHIGANSITVNIAYPTLLAVGKTVPLTVSEYSATATFAAPVTISGGLAPYDITFTGFSDSRFTASGSNIMITVAQFTTGSTVNCAVSMLVTDSSGQNSTTVGTLQLTIEQEEFVTVNFSNALWLVTVSTDIPFTASIIPNQNQSIVQLGHPPYQYYIDSVSLPGGLGAFVVVSPTNRVLAIQYNDTATSATVSDENSSLIPSGSYVVAATAFASAPPVGTYNIALELRVVDSEGFSAAQTVNLTLVIS